MLRNFIIVVLCYLASPIISQPDSFLDLASAQQNDSLNIYFTHAAAQRIHSDTSIKLLHQSLNLAKSISHSYWVAKLHQTLGKKYSQIDGAIDSLYVYSSIARDGFRTLQLPIETARSAMQMGMAEMNRGNRTSAISLLTEAARIFEEEGALSVLAPVYINISSVLHQSEDYKSELQYLLKAHAITLNSGDLRNQAIASMGIQSRYADMDFLDSAATYAQDALRLSRQLNDPILLRYSALNLGKLALKQGDVKAAEQYYLQMLTPSLSGSERSRALYWMGSFYAETNQHQLADQYLEQASILATEAGANDLSINILTEWRDVLSKIGRYKKSNEVTDQYIILTDSLHSVEVRKSINELTIKYEAEKKDRENQVLNTNLKQNEIEILKLNDRVKQQVFVIALTLLSLISIGIFYFLNKRNQRQKSELARQRGILQDQKIKDMETDQILLSIKSLVRGQEEERSRIAKELHDGLGSIMSSLKLSISQLPNYSERLDYQQQIRHALGLSDHANRELRRIAQNLMPETLTRFGLIAALEDFIAEINFTKTVNIQFQYFYKDENLANDLSLSIYRIIQELLQNAIKHAGATEILVQLMKHDELISITVEDDGNGFDTAVPHLGSGFSNIASRLTFFDGSMRVESMKGEGSTIYIECPIAQSIEKNNDAIEKN